MTSASHSNKIIVDWGNDIIANVNGVIFTQKSELTVNSDGRLTYPEYPAFSNFSFYNTSFSYISGDTIRFGISEGGLGFWRQWEVIGLKIKNTNY